MSVLGSSSQLDHCLMPNESAAIYIYRFYDLVFSLNSCLGETFFLSSDENANYLCNE